MSAPFEFVSAVKWYIRNRPRFALRFAPDEKFVVPHPNGRVLHMDNDELQRYIDTRPFYVLDTFVKRP